MSAQVFIWLDKISSLAASLGLFLLGSSLLRFDSIFDSIVRHAHAINIYTRRFLDAMWWVIWSSFITSWRRIVLASRKSERMPRYLNCIWCHYPCVFKVPFKKIHKYASWSLKPWSTLHLCSDSDAVPILTLTMLHMLSSGSTFEHFIFSKMLSALESPGQSKL